MSSLLRQIFALVGSLGIVGPHAGHDADLLLAGKKPIGLLCCINISVAEQAPESLVVLDEIARLDKAVEAGQLSKIVSRIPPLTIWDGADGAAHFYCQKGREAELAELAKHHEQLWRGRESEGNLPRDVGLYLGYTEEDVALYLNGGYDALPFLPRVFMKSTHELRKWARLASMPAPND